MRIFYVKSQSFRRVPFGVFQACEVASGQLIPTVCQKVAYSAKTAEFGIWVP